MYRCTSGYEGGITNSTAVSTTRMSNEDANSHLHTKIGRSLEQARTERHLRLWRVEEATKIRARYPQDLKRENFDVLPAVYVLGSLKTYADYLELSGSRSPGSSRTGRRPCNKSKTRRRRADKRRAQRILGRPRPSARASWPLTPARTTKTLPPRQRSPVVVPACT